MKFGTIRPRLSLMMFGQYFVMGSWAVTLATFLMSSPLQGGLNFSASQTAWIYSTLAIAGILSPLLVGILADRFFSAQKMMGVFHLLGSLLLFTVALWCQLRGPLIADWYRHILEDHSINGIPFLDCDYRDPLLRESIREVEQTANRDPDLQALINDTFYPMLCLMFGYSICFVMSNTLCNVVALRNLADPQRSFGRVRLFGTVGWIAAGIVIEMALSTVSVASLYLAVATSVLMGIGCFFLPKTPPAGQGKSLGGLLGLPALNMFRQKPLAILIACAVLISLRQQFYTIYTNRFLMELGYNAPTAVQTIAQIGEVLSMAIFPWIMLRLSLKTMMLVGLLGLTLRNGIFSSDIGWMVVNIGLPLHGIGYAFFYVVASIYVDQQAPPDLRASAQGIVTFITMGLGNLVGNWISGQIVEANKIGQSIDWLIVWLVPTVICGTIFTLFAIFFRDATDKKLG